MENETRTETETKLKAEPKVIVERAKKEEPKDNGAKKETKPVKKEAKAAKKDDEKPTFQYVPIAKIVVEPGANPRKIFDREYLKELADSIRTEGIINPLTLTLRKGQFILVAGECRLRAAKIVGLTDVPAMVRAADEQDPVNDDLIRLIENVQRRDIRPMEEALNFKKLLGKTEMQAGVAVVLNVKNLAQRVGKTAGHVSQRLALLELHKDIQQALFKEEITVSQARELHSAGDEKLQLKLLAKIKGSDDTVRVKDIKSDIDKSKAKRNVANADSKRRGRPPQEDSVAPNVARQGLEAALEHLANVKLNLKKVTEVREGMAMVYERFDKAKSDEKKMFYKGAIAALEWATGIKEEV